MLQYLTIPIEDVYAGIGMVFHDYLADTRLRPARPWDKVSSYGLMLYWPKKDPWLSIDVVAQASLTSPPTSFVSHKEAVEFICRHHGVDPTRIAPAGFLNAAEVRVGSLTNTANVTLRIAIDTGHDAFRAALRDRVLPGKSELVQTLNVRMFDTKSLNSYFEQSGTVQLVLRPACTVPPYYGIVALDLGNTSSDLACVSKRDPVYRTASLKLLDAEPTRPTLGENPTALVSTLRIDRIVSLSEPPHGTRRFPELPEDDNPKAIDYVAGRLASAGADGASPGLVLGAKRLVSGKDTDGFRKLIAQHRREIDGADTEEEIEVQNRIPAELLACRLLEKFRSAAKAWPGELAVTYPTTYTPRELARLTEAVERAWLRMHGQPQSLGAGNPPDDPDLARLVASTQARLAVGGADGAETGIIRLKLDEATAAAFFFLYRRIFESPGGLLRFRYLYPNGMNLLLYDCGGGTTDIALVRATAVTSQHLRIGVLGRTGLRAFGGDDMTVPVARLLKTKLIAELLKVRGKLPPNPPPKSNDPKIARDALEQYMTKVRDLDPDDQIVPTRFVRGQFDAATRERRRHALELWQWAEAFKADLAASAGTVKFGGAQKFRDALAEPMFRGLTDAQAKTAEAQLKTVAVHRWEVDALLDGPSKVDGRTVSGPVTRSVEKCNRLIQDVLRDRKTADGLTEEEIHWVVISGNAARYPILRERMMQQLQVEDLGERLTLDEANLKHAVAKGASLFLVTTRTPGLQVVIDTDVDLSACLPFDVGYFDLAKREHRPLFREHQKYTELKPQRVPMAAAGRPGSEEMKTFFLERRFPGDEEYSRFQAFEFRDGISGELEIAYEPTSHEFIVTDASSGAVGEPTDLTDGDVYLAPAERGDL